MNTMAEDVYAEKLKQTYDTEFNKRYMELLKAGKGHDYAHTEAHSYAFSYADNYAKAYKKADKIMREKADKIMREKADKIMRKNV